MTKWKAAQASVPVSQRIMVLTDGAASSNILSWWAPNSCDDKVFSVSSHFHNLVSISIRTSSSNNWLLTFLKLFAWSGKAIKSPMDPEMNIKSWLLQRTAAFEVNVLKHVKYTSAVQQKREYFKRILSSTSFLLPSSLKCSVYQTACWVRKVSRVGCYLKVHSARRCPYLWQGCGGGLSLGRPIFWLYCHQTRACNAAHPPSLQLASGDTCTIQPFCRIVLHGICHAPAHRPECA